MAALCHKIIEYSSVYKHENHQEDSKVILVHKEL